MARAVCTVIIVVHDSDAVIHRAIDALDRQTRPADRVVIVDSGSADFQYLAPYRQRKKICFVVGGREIGFCRANNIGMKHLADKSAYVLFLNPDAFLTPHFIDQAVEFMEDPSHRDVGAITGSLIGYDIQSGKPSNRFDSTGIFHTRYGRWYDRGQGELCSSARYTKRESVPAVCGALMFCRRTALQEVMVRGDEVFDKTFFMYKEDIDLSLRLRKAGWDIQFVPHLVAYHCRGWNARRCKVKRQFRLRSARNELRINARLGLLGTCYSALKYVAVKVFDI